jgi:hypothetical protein
MINLPSWIPARIRPILEQMDRNPACFGHRRDVFERMLSDPKMEPVYAEFLRHDRETGDFFHPAAHRTNQQTVEEAQLQAIWETLEQVVSAAGDQLSVSKIEQIEEVKKRYGDLAIRLRELAHDMELAIKHRLLMPDDDPLFEDIARHDAQALLRVANWLDHLTTTMRHPGDPLIVKRHRGDPIAKGVQITIGAKLAGLFGKRLDGTAATLTSVALGVKATARASRSALTKRKPSKKRAPKTQRNP